MNAIDQTTVQPMVERADPFLLIASLASRGADAGLLEEAMPFALRGVERKADDLPDDLRKRLKARAHEHLGRGPQSPLPRSDPKWRQIVNFAAGVAVPDEYVDMLMEEASIWPRRLYQPDQSPPRPGSAPEVAIIGAGLSGIGIAVYLKKAGIPFTIYEKNPASGGTWYDNRYPGCGVDTASHIYTYSFALNPAWKRYFSKQADVLDYVESCIERFDLRPHIRFGCSVSGAEYDEEARRWRVSVATEAGEELEVSSDILVSAVGQLNVPALPRVAGLDSFRGDVVHTAQWRPDVAVEGRRVAMIGSGASAVQAGPTMAPAASKFLVFQRSPQWLSSRPLYHQPTRAEDLWAFAHIPDYLNWHRLALFWQFGDRLYPSLMLEDGPEGPRLSAQSNDVRRLFTTYIHEKLADRPDLIEKVVPDYPPLAKRVPIDFGWFDMLKRDNVELITDAIDHVEADAIVTADGRRHEVDTIVLATGFQATRMLQSVPIRGRDGAELQKVWSGDDPRAYLGMMVPGFPNLFIMYGPNTNLGHGGSLIFQIECQARYIVSAISHLASGTSREVEVRPEVCDAYNEELDRLLERTVWNSPGVNNWFKNSRGRIATNSPWRLVDYWSRTRSFDPADCVQS